MRAFTIVILCTFINFSYGQQNRNEICGKWLLINFEIESLLVFDKKNPTNVINQHMDLLRSIKPDYTTADSIEYINQIMSQISPFEKYSIEFLNNGTYRNTKISRGRVTKEMEEGKFEVVKNSQTLIQTDNKQRITESRFEINGNTLRLFMLISDKNMVMTFEKRR